MEFFVDAVRVNPQGVPGHPEFVGDFFHEVALGEEGENLVFTGREDIENLGLRVRLGALKTLNDAASDSSAHGGTAFSNLFHSLEHAFRVHGLGEVAYRASGEGLEDGLRVVEHGDHDDLEAGHERGEATHALHTTHAGEVDIEEYQIGGEGGKFLKRLLGGAGDSDALDSAAGLVENGLEIGGEASVVLDDGDLARGCGGFIHERIFLGVEK